MRNLTRAVSRWFVPGFDQASERDQATIRLNAAGLLVAAPFAVLGLIALIALTDLGVVAQHWPVLLFAAVLYYLLEEHLDFRVFLDPRNLQARASGSFGSTVSWSAALLFGPTALWIVAPELIFTAVKAWRKSAEPAVHLEITRNAAQQTCITLSMLVGLGVYQALGGSIPFPGFNLADVLRAAAGVLANLAAVLVVLLPFLIYFARVSATAFGRASGSAILRGFLSFTLVITFIELFGILAAGLYAELGLELYLVGAFAVVMVSLLAHQLSDALTLAAERNRALQQIGDLGRAILTAPAERALLPALVAEHTGELFAGSRFEARLFDGTVLMRRERDWPEVPAEIWRELERTREPYLVLPGMRVESDRTVRREALAVPIRDGETGDAIGGIYVLRNRDRGPVLQVLPTAQAFGEQIASALLRVRAHDKAVAAQRAEQELEIAAAVQTSLLPERAPQAPGWTFAGFLRAARTASGDFLDFIELRDGHIGLLIADVADKGLGAAMVMALSRTLIRTFALEHPGRPDLALRSANRRLCEDLRADTFVTVFLGALDLRTGQLSYCNAGHCRPLLIAPVGRTQSLESSGMALGVFPEIELALHRVTIAPGEVLLAYTDGLTDGQNAAGEFFGDARLAAVAHAQAGKPAPEARESIDAAFRDFAAVSEPFDDVTLLVVSREA